MPGISFAVGPRLAAEPLRRSIPIALRAMEYLPHYGSQSVLSADDLFLGYTGYEGYPIRVFESAGYAVVVEGLIYNRSEGEVEQQLGDFASRLATGRSVDKDIADWVGGSDGDYLVLMVSPDRRHLLLFNDALARLPCYWYRDPEKILVSREVKFLTLLRENIKYDRLCMAQMLFFGYPLGLRTLVEGVSRLEGGSLLDVDFGKLTVRSSRTHVLNLDSRAHAGKPVGRAAGEFKECFVAACANVSRALRGRPHVISLSGGLDSRSVAAGLKAGGAIVHAATFQDAGISVSGLDAVFARQVAEALGIDWSLIDVQSATADDMRRLVLMTEGLNYSGMAFILQFFETLRGRFGPDMVYCTGAHGDRVMADLRPSWKLRSVDDLLHVIVERNQRIPLDRVSALTGVRRKEFIDAVAQRLGEYPEADVAQRYARFTIVEKLGNLICNSEKRDRCYFWYVAPFMMLSVLRYAMNVPPETKSKLRFYEQFLAALAPALMPVPNAAWRAPFASPQRYLRGVAYGWYAKLPVRIRRTIQDWTMYRGRVVAPEQRMYLEVCRKETSLVGQYLANQAMPFFLAPRANRYVFEILLTIAAYINVNEGLRKQMLMSAAGTGR